MHRVSKSSLSTKICMYTKYSMKLWKVGKDGPGAVDRMVPQSSQGLGTVWFPLTKLESPHRLHRVFSRYTKRVTP